MVGCHKVAKYCCNVCLYVHVSAKLCTCTCMSDLCSLNPRSAEGCNDK